MATSKKEQMTPAQYEALRVGYAQSFEFDPYNLSEEQEHQVIEAMAAENIVAPSTKALAGTSEINPSHVNAAELVEAPKGKATRGKGKKPVASIGNLDDSIRQVLVSAAQQGAQVGDLAGAVFNHQLVTNRDAVIAGSLADGLIQSDYAGMTVQDFLLTM